jgi:hypothetical protein
MATENNVLSLDKKDRKKLQKLSTQDHPDAARAKALLALNEGLTQAAAADSAGLTLPQLRYWLGRFRSKQFECFTSLNEDKPAKQKKKKADKPKADKKAKKTDKKKGKKGKKSAKKKAKK